LIDVYLAAHTAKIVRARFDYCFESPPGSDYPPIVRERRFTAGQTITVEGPGGPITGLPILQAHGDTPSFGFRFGRVAYSCDLSDLPAESVVALADTDVWILDALRYRPHPSHFSVADALGWIERLKPQRAILTNLHTDLDYEKLRRELPPQVEPAFDGMSIEVQDH
jgi:phosphoribosyl 1,2-cyclic phosphate phosphodiesterase